MLNRAEIIGRVGKDPEVRYTPSGKAVCSFSVASTEKWGTGEDRKEHTEWFKIVAWGKLGEICGEYLKKGSLIYLDGRIQTRQWEDKEGRKNYTTEIIAANMKMLGEKPKSEPAKKEPEPEIPDEDIPF